MDGKTFIETEERGFVFDGAGMGKHAILEAKLVSILGHAQWEQRESFLRCLQTVGFKLDFLHVHALEGDLREFRKAMRRKHIPNCELPSLNGDTRDFYLAVSLYQIPFVLALQKTEPFDGMGIKAVPTTAEHYLRSGYRNGRQTEQLKQLEQSAAEHQKERTHDNGNEK